LFNPEIQIDNCWETEKEIKEFKERIEIVCDCFSDVKIEKLIEKSSKILRCIGWEGIWGSW
jgi:hypothetical protein